MHVTDCAWRQHLPPTTLVFHSPRVFSIIVVWIPTLISFMVYDLLTSRTVFSFPQAHCVQTYLYFLPKAPISSSEKYSNFQLSYEMFPYLSIDKIYFDPQQFHQIFCRICKQMAFITQYDYSTEMFCFFGRHTKFVVHNLLDMYVMPRLLITSM